MEYLALNSKHGFSIYSRPPSTSFHWLWGVSEPSSSGGACGNFSLIDGGMWYIS